jgi:hypothetical protein
VLELTVMVEVAVPPGEIEAGVGVAAWSANTEAVTVTEAVPVPEA